VALTNHFLMIAALNESLYRGATVEGSSRDQMPCTSRDEAGSPPLAAGYQMPFPMRGDLFFLNDVRFNILPVGVLTREQSDTIENLSRRGDDRCHV
jgi:hypothetical protein